MSFLPWSLLFAVETDPWSLVRVDEPDLPGAVISSAYGSVLSDIPDDPSLKWRIEPIPELDEVVAQGALEALAVPPWHAKGWGGAGIKVAVFDPQWLNFSLYENELGDFETHDCGLHRSCAPPIDPLSARFGWEQGAHGVACAEVIRDIAPDAELHLVRVNGLTSFENAVDWAIREQVDLISMSLSFFNESFYDGTGSINEEVQRLSDAGVLLVTSAGNYAEEHWSGVFEDSNLDGLHDFEASSRGLPIYWKSGTRRLYLSWDQFGFCGQTDLDAYVYNSSGNLVGRATSSQDVERQNCQPVERVSVQAADEGWYYLRVQHVAGAPAVRMRVLARGGEIWEGNAEGSITDPGTHPLALTVGAVRATDYLFNDAEYFSSRGPTSAGLNKPDISGPNGLNTYSYGPASFYGTSASTPAVVGALALEMSAHPGMSGRTAANRLMDQAQSASPTWGQNDHALGAGKARLSDSPTRPGFGCTDAATVWPIFCVPWIGWRRRRSRRHPPHPE